MTSSEGLGFARVPIGGAVECWQSYPPPIDTHVATSRRLILSAAQRVGRGEALVLGAGECQEIPLAELVERFDTVTLVDVDEQALSRALDLHRLTPSQRQRVRTTVAELNGFGPDHLAAVLTATERCTEAEQAVTAAAAALNRLMPAPFVANAKANLVVASCVLSQLHLPLLCAISQGLEGRFEGLRATFPENESWSRAAMAFSERLEKNFIETLRHNVASGGRVYLAATIHRMEYRVTEDGQWQSPGLFRVCRRAGLRDYVDEAFQTEYQEQWWWDISQVRQPLQKGHGYQVQGAILRPRKLAPRDQLS